MCTYYSSVLSEGIVEGISSQDNTVHYHTPDTTL